jgi:hypothetical protein
MWFLRSWKAGDMGTREWDLEEPGDFEPGDNFAPGDLLIALDGEDIFLVPQSRSESRSVGKDENSRPSAAHPMCAIDQVGSLIEWL